MENIYDLSEVSLERCEDINLNEMLFYVIRDIRCIPKRHILKGILNIVRSRIFYGFTFETKGNGNNVYFFSNDCSGRKDHEKNFRNVVNLSNNYICIVGNMNHGKIKKSGIPISLIVKWNRILKRVIPNVVHRFYIVEKIYCILSDYQDYCIFIKEGGYQIKNFVSWCDVMSEDYFFTYKANQNNIRTFTLQHGNFTQYSNKYAFIHSHSKVFLAFSQYTINEAKKAGYDNGIMEVVGMPSSIASISQSEKVTNNKLNTIGLLLDSEICYESNCDMLKVVQEYVAKGRIKLKIKLHPSNNIEKYKHFIQEQGNISVVRKEMLIDDFIKEIDFAVVRDSTCLLQLLESHIPTVIWKDNNKINAYDSVKTSMKFSTIDELEKLMKLYKNGELTEEINRIRELFLPTNDVKRLYIKVMRKYGLI